MVQLCGTAQPTKISVVNFLKEFCSNVHKHKTQHHINRCLIFDFKFGLNVKTVKLIEIKFSFVTSLRVLFWLIFVMMAFVSVLYFQCVHNFSMASVFLCYWLWRCLTKMAKNNAAHWTIITKSYRKIKWISL